jgi:hypothetical protein
MDTAYGLVADHARRGERDGSIVCHKCDDNKEGFCKKYHKWCSSVRSYCEPKIQQETISNTSEQENKDSRRVWKSLYGSKNQIQPRKC